MQLLLPLLSSYHLKSGKISNSNNMWEKLKQGTHQIVEELTAPPTVGAVSYFDTSSIQEECTMFGTLARSPITNFDYYF